MVTCERALPLITRDVDSVLSGDDRAALADHVSQCDACRSAFDEQHAVAHLVRARPAAEAPPWFAVRVAARLAGGPTWFDVAEWRTWTWRLLPVATALFIAAAWLAGGTTGSQAPSASGTAATLTATASDAAPAAVLWEDNVTSDQVLLTVLTGSRTASAQGNSHE